MHVFRCAEVVLRSVTGVSHNRRRCFRASQACREWLKPEEEGSDEDDVPEEWHLAATMAGCGDVNEMLVELDLRVSALEEVRSVQKGNE